MVCGYSVREIVEKVLWLACALHSQRTVVVVNKFEFRDFRSQPLANLSRILHPVLVGLHL